jgi:hypothetical protein
VAGQLRDRLRERGYGYEAIEKMTMAQAQKILLAEEQRERERQQRQQRQKQRDANSAVRGWDEIEVPPTANALERLTYVPGAVGDIARFVVGAAIRPNRMMALAVGLGVVGTLIGRKIIGPKNNATHLYIVMLAPTGYGKDDPMTLGTAVMEAVGAGALLGPQEYASAPGFLKSLAEQPLQLCFVDELGDEFQHINNQNGNTVVQKIFGELKKCYNSFAVVRTARKVEDESATIDWPAPFIVGASTPQMFFEAFSLTLANSEQAYRPRGMRNIGSLSTIS